MISDASVYTNSISCLQESIWQSTVKMNTLRCRTSYYGFLLKLLQSRVTYQKVHYSVSPFQQSNDLNAFISIVRKYLQNTTEAHSVNIVFSKSLNSMFNMNESSKELRLCFNRKAKRRQNLFSSLFSQIIIPVQNLIIMVQIQSQKITEFKTN